MSDLILYTSEDGQTRMQLRVKGQTIWLTQLEIAELFQTTKQNVSLHAQNIFAERELQPEATVKESLTVQTEGGREVKRALGVTLPLALAELGLIDEYQFVVQPRLAGHGPTLFAGLSKHIDLKLVSRLEFASGAVAMRYEPRR